MVLRKLSQSFKVAMALMVATFSTGLLPTAVAYATPQAWTEATNHIEYWQNLGYGTCTKIDEPGGTNYTLPAPTAGSTWSLLVVKASTENEVYENPTVGVAYNAPLTTNGQNAGQPRTVSHVIFCSKTTTPTDVCPNILDNQATIPEGMVKDENGDCVTPPTGQIVTPSVDQDVVCGPSNDVFTVIEGDNYDVVDNGDGTFTLTASSGYVFTSNGASVVTLTAPADANTACPMIAPCTVTTGPEMISEASDFADTQDTRSAGHYEFVEDGLHIYTDDSSSQAKVAWYHSVSYPLTQVGEPSISYTSDLGIKPGMQIALDKDSNGTVDGIIVGEPDFYGNNWWSNADFGVGASMGYTSYGTLQDYLDANPNAVVKAVGFSLGSGVHADGVLASLTFGCHTWTFGSEDEVEDTNDGLCHATGSGKYVLIEDISSAGIFNGHYGEGRGDHQNGEDIIPPFTFNGETYSQNWDEAGMAIYDAECETPPTPTVCSVSNNSFLMPWSFGGSTNPVAGSSPAGIPGTFSFQPTGLYISTPNIESYVYGEVSAGNTPVRDIDQMSYKTLRLATSTGNSQVVTAYIVNVDRDGDLATNDTTYLFYEPIYNGTVTTGTWQTWDVLNGGNGVIWSFELTDGNPTLTWNEFKADYPNAVALSYGFNQGTYNQGTDAAVQDLAFDCATTSFSATGGQGGGQVLGDQTGGGGQGGGKVLSAVLPAMLPSTGGNDSPFMIIVAALMAYGAAYFLQGRRLLGRKQAIEA